MTTDHGSTIPLDDLEHRTARHLLGLCERRAGTPAARLMEQLAEPGGQDWARQTLAGISAEGETDGLSILLSGAGGFAAARSLKHAGKSGIKSAANDTHEARAVLCYLAAVAAALVHHGELLSSRKPSTLAELFIDLGEALDRPMAEIFEKAIEHAIAHDSAVSRLKALEDPKNRSSS